MLLVAFHWRFPANSGIHERPRSPACIHTITVWTLHWCSLGYAVCPGAVQFELQTLPRESYREWTRGSRDGGGVLQRFGYLPDGLAYLCEGVHNC